MSSLARRKLRNRRLAKGGLIAVAVIAIGAIILSFVNDRRERSAVRSALEAADCALDTRTDPDAGTGNNHRSGVAYQVDPPAGGDHSPSPMGPGRYDAAEAPDDRLVHSLEHGYVIVWHRPDVDAEARESLEDLQRAYSRDALLVERETLDVPVAATAWHQRALCGEVDTDALGRFVEFYRNKGPERVPH